MPSQLNNDDRDVLLAAESDIRARLVELDLDFPALMAISNIHRAATAVRSRMEREVLAETGLSWGGFTILFVLWIWGDMETHRLADECGLAKGTLSGMVDTLERNECVSRRRLTADRRRVEVTLTDRGEDLIASVFPAFNSQESMLVASLDAREVSELSRLLRTVITTAESAPD